MKNRIVISGVALLMIFSGVAGVFVCSALATATQDDSAYSNIAVLTRALKLIRQDYVDEKKISYRDLTYHALRGMLANLDPHNQFMEPQDFKGMQDDTKSQFGGLGVVVSMKDGMLTIVSPMEDTPGFKNRTAAGRSDFENQRHFDGEDGSLRGDPAASRRAG